jgi:hypothetical protein
VFYSILRFGQKSRPAHDTAAPVPNQGGTSAAFRKDRLISYANVIVDWPFANEIGPKVMELVCVVVMVTVPVAPR